MTMPASTQKLRDVLLDRVSDDLGHQYRIFYMRQFAQNAKYTFLTENEPKPVVDMSEYVEIGRVIARNKEAAWQMMQGEVWSPNGEARPIIEALGIQHTSMSTGDILVSDDNEIFMVAMMGFVRCDLSAEDPEMQIQIMLDDQDEEHDPCLDRFYEGSEDFKIMKYQRGREHLERMEADYGHLYEAKAILEVFREYLHGTAEVEELGVSIHGYRAVVEDLLMGIDCMK